LFKHALVQEAAYGTLLREPRRVLHASIAETLKNQVAQIAHSQPKLLAHHFTQAGMTEAAVEWWRTAGQRSLARSGALFWKALGTVVRGSLSVLTGKASDAVRALTSGIASLRSTGATLYEPQHLQYLAMAYAELGQLDDAWRCIDDAIDKVEKSKEKWCEAEVHRIAGEIALKPVAPEPETRYLTIHQVREGFSVSDMWAPHPRITELSKPVRSAAQRTRRSGKRWQIISSSNEPNIRLLLFPFHRRQPPPRKWRLSESALHGQINSAK
jgi:hypothetical protein